ncbi:signal transduction histidine kinase [Streptomyces sp. SLBN-118]|uniref:sensor histidine kinase n=1 Tax=Streptomyces sp. SLBN-118 TaxID=2768454 RepID=UPI0011714997|nr:histidine kinase [Streptomyces sp. SLBN-118]TQK43729.1 signal transduction histidine kinase [Streptomyces sp. SLBN-118]
MKRAIKASTRALFGTRAGLRWLHLILGGALLMPYWLAGTVIVGPLVGANSMFSDSLALQFGAYAVALPTAAVTALFFPLTRPLAVGMAKALCAVPAERFAEGPARSRAARLRASAWFTLHAGMGALISGASLALPPFAVSLIVLPLFPALRARLELPHFPAWQLALFPFAGVAMLIALAACAAAAGALLARQAPVLLGPTPADRLAAAERRATELAERNRLARELHDSVGHALSAVTLQAGAARKVLESDPDFVREALAAIEETTRRTVGELDCVLGLLRHDDDHTTQLDGPTLDTLDGLLARSGVLVSLTADGDLAAVPPPVSREAYRIVQEGLSNALRHAGASPVTLWIALRGEELEITMENPLPDRTPVVRPGGGRGVRGITERAALLGGVAQAGARGAVWRLSALLPLGGER